LRDGVGMRMISIPVQVSSQNAISDTSGQRVVTPTVIGRPNTTHVHTALAFIDKKKI